jgi:uncharacterized protein YjlB
MTSPQIRQVVPQQHLLESHGGIPGSRLPVLVYPSAWDRDQLDGEAACALLKRNGWGGNWVYGVYPFWHFHTRGHEVLVCLSGSARLGLGGDDGVAADVSPGDVLVLPAGTGHRCLSASDDFLVAGGYPPGQEGNIVRPGEIDVDEAAAEIEGLAMPETNPLTGAADGVVTLWKAAQG